MGQIEQITHIRTIILCINLIGEIFILTIRTRLAPRDSDRGKVHMVQVRFQVALVSRNANRLKGSS